MARRDIAIEIMELGRLQRNTKETQGRNDT